MEAIDVIYIIIYTVMLYCAILWFTVFFRNRKIVFNYPQSVRFPAVTMLVPAHNGDKHVKKCLDSILNLEYPKNKLKVILVDDGSTDRTSEIARKYKGVKILKQEHSGKAVALNNGLKHVTTELVGCMDVDSFPDKDSLSKMVGYIEKENISAVTPALKVSESKSLIGRIQWVEYIYMIFLRKALSLFGCEYVIPGPGGLYKTSVLKKLGGFDENNLTEDTEIAFRMIKNKYKIKNSINAYAYTDTPKNLKGLFKQRIRWYRGFLQNIRKYSKMVINPSYGNLGLFLLPANLLLILFGGFLLISIVYNFLDQISTFISDWSSIKFAIMPLRINLFNFIDIYTFFLALFISISILIIGFSLIYSGEKISMKSRILSYLSFLFIYPFLISIFWIMSVVYELFGMRKEW